MICSVRTLGINGTHASPVIVECYISNGLPGFDIVGLPDAAVKEARERVRAAADALECIVDKSYWPMPSYGDLLFSI